MDPLEQAHTVECTAYLVPLDWWQQWLLHTTEDAPRPPRIDNALLKERLSQGQVEGSCKAVQRSQWRLLRKWYGGGPELEVCLGNDVTEWLPVRACTYEEYAGSRSPWEVLFVPATVDWSTLHQYLCGRFKVNKAIIHLVQLDAFGRTALQTLDSEELVSLSRHCELVLEADEETDDELPVQTGRNSSTGIS